MQNVELDGEGQPRTMAGEVMRSGCRVGISAILDDRHITCRGLAYLSTIRIVFVGHSLTLDLPLLTMEEEAFQQPIFGPSALVGTSPPLPGSGIANRIRWKLTFTDGIGEFLPLFFMALEHIRNVGDADPDASSPPSVAYLDPGNTSVLYITRDASLTSLRSENAS
jgi:hypothetical protein